MIYKILAGVGSLILAGFLIFMFGNARERAGVMKERAKWEAARADTIAKQQADARAQEAADAEKRDQAAYDTQARIDALRGSLALWMRNRQAAGSASYLPGSTEAAVDSVAAGSDAVVSGSDLVICTDNTARLLGWQNWYNGVAR